MAGIRPGALERLFDRLLVPPVLRDVPDGKRPQPWNDDFMRVVSVVAIAAVGFFAPSLLIAGVPQEFWLVYLIAAGGAGVVVAGSFVFLRPGTRVASVGAVINVFV